jgi:hypothetical protein
MLKMSLAKKGKFIYNNIETMIDIFIIKGAIEYVRQYKAVKCSYIY